MEKPKRLTEVAQKWWNEAYHQTLLWNRQVGGGGRGGGDAGVCGQSLNNAVLRIFGAIRVWKVGFGGSLVLGAGVRIVGSGF